MPVVECSFEVICACCGRELEAESFFSIAHDAELVRVKPCDNCHKSPPNKAVEAMIEWWEMKRPTAYSLEEHINNPKVNCRSASEERLAAQVAKIIGGV